MSTYNLVLTARPGGILAVAQDSQEFQAHLAPFSGNQPLDLAYASLHTQWLHWSDIPIRCVRLKRDDQGTRRSTSTTPPGARGSSQRPCGWGSAEPLASRGGTRPPLGHLDGCTAPTTGMIPGGRLPWCRSCGRTSTTGAP